MKFLLTALIGLVITFPSFSQKKALSLEQAVLGYYTGLYPEGMNGLSWLPETEMYSAINNDILYVFDKEGKIKKKITLAELKEIIKNNDLSYMPSLTWESKSSFSFIAGDKLYLVDPFKYKLNRFIDLPDNFENPDFNALSENMAYTTGRNLNIWRNNKQIRITNNDEHTSSGQAIARFEFGISKGTFWSPNGEYLAFYEKEEKNVTEYPLLDYSTTPASSNPIKYPMAGQASEHGRIGVTDATTGKKVYLEQTGGKEDYVTNIAWSPDNKYLYVVHINRTQTNLKINKYDKKGLFLQTIYTEHNEKYVEPENPPQFIPNGKGDFLWLTEKSGFNNLVLMNDNGIVNELTNFQFDITEFIAFDENGTTAFFHATGENPTEMHGFSLNLKTGEVTQLTSEKGYHNIQVSSSGDYFIDSYSSLEVPNKITLKRIGQNKDLVLLEASNPLTEYSVGSTEIFPKKASDGTELWCRMIKPSHFSDSISYPVLVYVYNGPHVQLVTNSWLGGASLWMHSLAEEGYIIFTVDGRGSAHRGIAFEQAIHEKMGSIEVQDQADMVKWLKSLPYTDKERFAVHGWSYGGFMTTSLMLKKPGTFKVGVAGGPVIDWRLYEVMYTERYMDTPESNPEGYLKADLKNYVSNLEGKLMLIHGTNDDVVVMQHSQEFLKRCIEEGIPVDFFPYPGHAHNVRGRDRVHLMTKVLDYIKTGLQ